MLRTQKKIFFSTECTAAFPCVRMVDDNMTHNGKTQRNIPLSHCQIGNWPKAAYFGEEVES